MLPLFILQIPETKQPPVPKMESPEGYYEEAEPYDVSVNGISQLTLRVGVWEMEDLRYMRTSKQKRGRFIQLVRQNCFLMLVTVDIADLMVVGKKRLLNYSFLTFL